MISVQKVSRTTSINNAFILRSRLSGIVNNEDIPLSIHAQKAPFDSPYGPGGRSSNSGITATVFGGYGFVGRYVCNELGKVGSRVYAPFRGDEMEVRHLKPSFDLGQLGLLPFSPRDRESIYESVKKSDVVINLIGKHYETKHFVPTRRADGSLSRINYDFNEVHNTIPALIAEVAKEAGVKRFIHVSALSANVNSVSDFNRTKALGEISVREKFPEATIVRPAHVYGDEDKFLQWTAQYIESKHPWTMLRYFPIVEGGQKLVQPLFAPDLARGIMATVRAGSELKGRDVNLAGPAEYTYKEIIEYVLDVTKRNEDLNSPWEFVDVPLPIARQVGKLMQNIHNPRLTEEIVLRCTEDSTVESRIANGLPNSNPVTFQDFAIQPKSIEEAAFETLEHFRPGSHFLYAKGYH